MSESPTYFVSIVQLMSSLVAGFVGGVGVQAWKSRRDELRIACDEFCKMAAESADLGVEYWSVEGRIPKSEAKINGCQRKLSGYAVLLRKILHRQGGAEIDAALADFFDLLTGKDYNSPLRVPDPDRVVALQVCAADLVVTVRTVFLENVLIAAKVKRVLERLGMLRAFRAISETVLSLSA